MKKSADFLLLARFILLSGLIAGISSFSYADENNNNNNEEKKEDLVTTRSIISIGLTQQNYTGDYRENTKGSFVVCEINKTDLKYNTRDIDKSYGVNISYDFELQFNIFRILNPYLGFEVSLGVPFTKQHDYIDSDLSISISGGLTVDIVGGLKAYSFTGNFADAKLKAGNSFKVIKNVLDVNIYGMFGIGTTGYLGANVSAKMYDGTFKKLPYSLGISYGYVYGAGIDLILVKRLLIGAYYEERQMKDNIAHPKDGESIANLLNQGGIENYSNRTLGVKVGIVF